MFNKTKEQLNAIVTLLESFDDRFTKIERRLDRTNEDIDSNTSFIYDTLLDVQGCIADIESDVSETRRIIDKQYKQSEVE